MKNLGKIIKELDISEIEFEIYQEMLKLGPTTVLEISKKTSIPRTTVHQNIEKLLGKGLISQLATSTRRKLVAEEPKVLERMLTEKRLEIESSQNKIEAIGKLLPKIVKSLREGSTEPHSQSTTKVYDTKEQIDRLYDRILKSKEVRGIVNHPELISNFPENFNKFFQASENGTKIFDILIYPEKFDPTPFKPADKSLNYQYKVLENTGHNFKIDYLLYDNNICYVLQGSELSAINIESHALYQNSVLVYDLFWQSIPPHNTHNPKLATRNS